VVELPLAAWRGLAASFCAFDLPLADIREDGAEVLVLDDGCLGNLPQLVKGGVRQVEPAVADRQPAIGIIDHSDAFAAELAGDLVRVPKDLCDTIGKPEIVQALGKVRDPAEAKRKGAEKVREIHARFERLRSGARLTTEMIERECQDIARDALEFLKTERLTGRQEVAFGERRASPINA
jgi:hypothetical protein